MQNSGRWLLMVAGLLTAVVATAEVLPAPRWPLDIDSRYLTSNFMEHRDGRFHAGIDLKTNSRCGYVCRAVEDGWISRIKVSANGYGRALYLRGESGRTFVYAHLGRFAAPWQEVVSEAQLAKGGWAVDLSCPAGRWPVTAGDVIALSGQSGTDGPHLHFEVRDGAQRPLNPFGEGFAAIDTIGPVIERVRIMPSAAGVRIGGTGGGRVIEGDGGGGLTGHLPELSVSGPISLSASVIDKADSRGHRLEAWRITLTIDDQEVASWRNDRFDFATQSTMRLEWLECGGIRERRLHLLPGNDLEGRKGARRGSALGLDDGRHHARLEAEDYAGNRASIDWDILVGAADSSSVAGESVWRPDTLGLRLPPDGQGRPRRLTPTLVLTETPGGGITGEAAAGVARAEADRGGRVIDGGGGSGLRVDAVCWLVDEDLGRDRQRSLRREQGLDLVGKPLRVIAAEWIGDGGPSLELPRVAVDSLDARTAVYFFDERKERWKWASDAEVGATGDRVRFVAAKPGLYAAMRDVEAPGFDLANETIHLQRSAQHEIGGVALPHWEAIVISCIEEGAGLVPDACRARLDGEAVIVEPDLPRDRLLLELPETVAPGRHRLDIEVGDGAGNVTTGEFTLVVPGAQ